ncbi:MAG TPA: DNA topoisomerase IB [Pseudomonas sp.]|nr:DNA topoisomerase IB [Pseudomonas sp.]
MSDPATLLQPGLLPDLRYVTDSQPGISRRRVRGKFVYFDAHGERVRDREEIRRLEQLAIPPAYTDVWICTDPQGHLQAVGRDARGRKQYRYHPDWRKVRDSGKYERLLAFGRALPQLRATVDRHLRLRTLNQDKVLATVVALLDATLIRVGNSQYARDNQSFGLTTLRNRHVKVQGNGLFFRFRGKSGIEHQISLNDPRLARIVRRCKELPGQQLFQYLDANGERRNVSSSDINFYLHSHSGDSFTAKDYRTWAGTTLALQYLTTASAAGESGSQHMLNEAIKQVASRLGNTPTICRKCYIHPAVLAAFSEGSLARLSRGRKRKGLSAEESRLMRFLEAQQERSA